MIHVVLCDDHAILRRGIRDTLLEDPLISVTAEAGSYPELREALQAWMAEQADPLLHGIPPPPLAVR